MRSAFNIVSAKQRRPDSRGHPHRSEYSVTLPLTRFGAAVRW